MNRRLLRYLAFPLVMCGFGLAAILGFQGLEAAWLTLVLLLLEVSLSFDNAVVNARVLDRLTPGQQSFFLTWGLVIPVFGVRFLGPLLMVAIAGQVGLGEALDAALRHPNEYRKLLEIAEPRILAFGGMFLLMVFFHYFFDDAKTLHWWQALERRLSAAGRIEALEVAIALIILVALVFVAPVGLRGDLMVSGVLGVVLQLLTTSLADGFDSGPQMAVRSGIASLIYLELLDASFSLDGTIGAFAITDNIGLIMVGLGLGALFIRSLTLMLSRERALDHLIYLEHGAHYAIGALGLVMLAGIPLAAHHIHVPEWLTGLIGVLLLAIALWDSLRQRRASS
ncbi:DUF475 domain-containing protein [Cyanobium sp. WAJ14-Wanaka]|uniref:DUF475 domain-containing protein n=1 Tax=Cyanobium sp. WAJ14-Wanaka TaxID=2823725 RepID=UPI0020CE5923|nr:DUF475 domain-containing protein [Cyanobium sp. WAJ14-Wanaka]MCP9774960.1 DUF475 domain-containing protein [Cyanobium sp. WAJ14-Wanaka]